jgi:uncharacterized repeat protein (TIGR01451 family)/fimbrial isopeptide formation D2 family protein
MKIMKKVVGLGLALFLVLSLMSLPPAAPAAAANEGSFVFFQVNGGSSASVSPNGQVTFTFSFMPNIDMTHGTVQIVDVPDNSLATELAHSPNPFEWVNKSAGSPCNGSITYSVANNSGSTFTVYAIFTMQTGSDSFFITSTPVSVNVQNALTIQKTTTATSVVPGSTITYQINVINSSGGQASNVVVSDLLNANLIYSSSTYTPSISGQALSWNLGTMQNNQVAAISLTVQVSTAAVSGTVVNNTAQVTATGFGSSSSTSGNTLIQTAQLNFTKSVDKTTVGPGGQLNYTIRFSNPLGSPTLSNVQIQDTLPPYTGYSTHSTNMGQATPVTSGSNVVYWNIGTMLPGTVVLATLQVTVFTTVPYNIFIQNSATVSGYMNQGGTVVPISISPAVAPQVTVVPSVFIISKTVSPSIVQPGQQVSFTITYRNNSSGTVSPITNCKIVDTVDSRISNVAFSGVTPVLSGATYTWSLGTLAPGQSGTVSFIGTVNYSVTAGTTIANTALISGDNVAQVSSTCQILVGLPSPITLSKSVSASTIAPGSSASYSISYSNPTTNPTIPTLVITDTLPQGLTFQGGTGGYNQNGTVFTWTLSNIPPGSTGTVTLSALLDPNATPGSTITNFVSASPGGANPVSASASFQVGSMAPSMLEIIKLATADSVKAGEYITYLITYANNGNLLMPAVVIEEPIPANTTFLNGNPSPAVDPTRNVISWNVGDLPPGANGTLMAQFTVPSTVPDGTVISNIAVGKVSGFQDVTTATVNVQVGAIFHGAYIKGYPDGTFQPERPITRAEIATMLTRILVLPTGVTVTVPPDVPQNHWAYSYIAAVIFQGVMTGYPDGTFLPEQPITRAELATVMERARGLFPLIVAPPTFPDIAGHWATGNIEAAHRAMFITGYPSGDFRPDQTITRAETVTLIDRSFGRGPLIGTGSDPIFPDVPSVHWAFAWVYEAALSHRGLHTIDGNEMLVEIINQPPT